MSDAPDIQCNNVAHRYFLLSSEIRRLLAFAKTRIYELKLPNDRPFHVRDFYKRFYFLAVSFLRVLNIYASTMLFNIKFDHRSYITRVVPKKRR